VENLLPSGKNLGVTHITHGCSRPHPVEWNIGEVVSALSKNPTRESEVAVGTGEYRQLALGLPALNEGNGPSVHSRPARDRQDATALSLSSISAWLTLHQRSNGE